jgi:hypothetical protein
MGDRDAGDRPMGRASNPWSLPPMRYPNHYTWLLLASALDVMLTLLVLYIWEGGEVNPFAAAVISHFGFQWAIVFKFATVLLVIMICEYVGRRNDASGRRLALVALAISAGVVAYTFILLFRAGPVGGHDWHTEEFHHS